MKLRCKVGDLAFLIRASNPENLNKMLTVLEPIGYFAEPTKFMYNGNAYEADIPGFYWWVEAQTTFISRIYDVDGNLIETKTPKQIHCVDSRLRPIRDQDGDDETLQWAPSPTKETA